MQQQILVIGATGYVGGRLVPLLLKKGYTVHALTRNPQKILSRPWGNHPQLIISQGDMHEKESIRPAVEKCDIIYYLVHSMEAKYSDFSEADRYAAYNLVETLKGATHKRLIYLSGLFPKEAELSPHLRSRAEVARILSLADAQLTTLRAAQLIGAGSASFEMLRWLTDRVPVMLTPKWTYVQTQPISITDALNYLTSVIECPETIGHSYDIGGPDILSYKDLVHLYAKSASLRKRWLIPFPWMTFKFSAQLVHLFTPIPYALALPLLEGMRNEVVCQDKRIKELIPLDLMPIELAIENALGHTRDQDISSSWLDAGLPSMPEWVILGDAQHAQGTVYSDGYSIRLDATPEEVWQPIVKIGGSTGWYSKNILWKTRGVIDIIFGGPGLARGRRSMEDLYVGDSLDFWRVLEIHPSKKLLLITEMRLPGVGLLDLSIHPGQKEGDGTTLTLSLYFKPHGIGGRLYWHLVSPFHRFVFLAMLKSIAKRLSKPILSPAARIKAPQFTKGTNQKR